MRTTIDIPDKTYRELKKAAAEKGSTVRQMVLDGVEMILLRRDAGPPTKRLKMPLIPSTRQDKLVIDSEKIYDLIDFP